MTLVFLAEAVAEFAEAADFYESRESGLGVRFRQEIEHACRFIERNPSLTRMRRGGYRRVNCPVFPYYVAYILRGDRVIVVAVAHGHRRPGYWRERLRHT